jgi:hypothetical protein
MRCCAEHLSPADDRPTFRVYAVDLKNRLRNIETDCRNRLHAWLLRIVGTFHGTHVPVEEPSTASKADIICGARSKNIL